MPVFRGKDGKPDLYTITDADLLVLEAIAHGYPCHGEEDNYIVVENPQYTIDNGKDPNLVLSIRRIAGE